MKVALFFLGLLAGLLLRSAEFSPADLDPARAEISAPNGHDSVVVLEEPDPLEPALVNAEEPPVRTFATQDAPMPNDSSQGEIALLKSELEAARWHCGYLLELLRSQKATAGITPRDRKLTDRYVIASTEADPLAPVDTAFVSFLNSLERRLEAAELTDAQRNAVREQFSSERMAQLGRVVKRYDDQLRPLRNTPTSAVDEWRASREQVARLVTEREDALRPLLPPELWNN